MKNKKILLVFILCITLLVTGCSKNKSAKTSKKITSQKCQELGGQVVEIDTEKEYCPSGQEFLGMVTDVNCICGCCK